MLAHSSLDSETLPHRAKITVHNNMYRRRSKLCEILKIVDRHNTGVMTRHKFHMCLQLADLPKPDRKIDKSVYGSFYTKDAFRYCDFLEAVKHDHVYRKLIENHWPQGPVTTNRHRPSMTPQPGLTGPIPPLSRGPPLARASCGGSRASSQMGGSFSRPPSNNPQAIRNYLRQMLTKKHQNVLKALKQADQQGTGQIDAEQLKSVLVQLNIVPKAQLESGDLNSYFQQFSRNGQIDYNTFAAQVRQDDLQQLEALSDEDLRHQSVKH